MNLIRHMVLGFGCWGGLTLCSTAQTEPYLMADTTVTDCTGQLADTGGPGEAYGNNENLVFTVDAGSPLEITFLNPVEIEPAAPGGGLLFDYLILFDGPNTNAPVLDTLYGTIQFPNSYTTSGALTVQFVSDASAQPEGFLLSWTANPPPPTPPQMTLDAPGSCPFTALQWEFTPPIECDLIDWTSLSITGTGGLSWSVDTTAAALISCGNDFTSQLILPLEEGMAIEGNCDLAAHLSVGLRDACDSAWTFDLSTTWSATGCPADPILTTDADTLCLGGCAWLEALPRGCHSTGITWTASDGSSFSGTGPWEVCPQSTTTYSATAIEDPSGISGTGSITITVIEFGAWISDTALCPGTTLPLPQPEIEGLWSGPGVSQNAPFSFHADSIGPGIHQIQFTTGGSNACASTTLIEVIDFSPPENLATCSNVPPFPLPNPAPDGTWSGPGVLSGLFDAQVADSLMGAGPYAIDYASSGCTATTLVHVDSLTPPIDLGSICSSEMPLALPSEPPGGSWSGPGWNGAESLWYPEEAGPGPFTLTYAMEGCQRQASGSVLPIDAGWTQSSCPEQPPYVPYPGFSPPGGTWSGPGISAAGSSTGLYDPGAVPDGQWSSLVYLAPNGCTDTLWMFNRQTTIAPSILHACAGDEENLFNQDGFQASPWCGTWAGLSGEPVTYIEDCDWEALAQDLALGSSFLTYSVNGCVDTLEVIVHPDSLNIGDWTSCLTDADTLLPAMPSGAEWTGNGITALAGESWSWEPALSGPGQHALVWTAPAGCSDTLYVFVEEAPTWPSPLDSALLCYNEEVLLPPTPSDEGNGPAPSPNNWSLNGTAWDAATTSEQLGTGLHELSLDWSGNGCTVSQQWTFEVLPPLALELTVEDSTLCPGQGTAASFTVTGGTAATGFNFTWSDSGPNLTQRTLIPSMTEWWWVEATDGCSYPARDSILLIVLEAFDWQPVMGEPVCFGSPADLLLDIPSHPEAQMILEGDTLGAGPVVVTLPGGTPVQWAAFDPLQGCEQDTALLVPSHPPLQAAFSVFPATDCIPWDAQPIGLIDLSVGGESGQWLWSAATLEDSLAPSPEAIDWSFGTNPNISLASPGQWTVSQVLTQAAGCADTTTQTICLLPPTQAWLPEAFSPNGDGNNDVLFPRGSGVKQWTMVITDSWGVVVWEESHGPYPPGSVLTSVGATGEPVGWSGNRTTSSKKAPTGVYAVSLSGMTDGGAPVLIQQYVRLVR